MQKRNQRKLVFPGFVILYYNPELISPIINPTIVIAIPKSDIKSEPKYEILTNVKLLFFINFLDIINEGTESINENITYFINNGIDITNATKHIILHIFAFSLLIFILCAIFIKTISPTRPNRLTRSLASFCIIVITSTSKEKTPSTIVAINNGVFFFGLFILLFILTPLKRNYII